VQPPIMAVTNKLSPNRRAHAIDPFLRRMLTGSAGVYRSARPPSVTTPSLGPKTPGPDHPYTDLANGQRLRRTGAGNRPGLALVAKEVRSAFRDDGRDRLQRENLDWFLRELNRREEGVWNR
jgi:hypothetical protein